VGRAGKEGFVTDPGGTTSADGTVIDPSQEYGYARPASRQEAFVQAADALRSKDGWSDGGPKELVADLALEGGGVKGIAIVGAVSVLAEAGYRFPRVAGTSAGAIAATLIAGISKAGKPMSALKGYLEGLSFVNFMPEGKLHAFMDHHFGKAGGAISDADILMHRMGLYPGDYLAEWLGPTLEQDLSVRTFADLKITPEDDPGMSLPEDRRYRLVVHTSDITRGQLVHLPWDYNYYGHDRDTQEVVPAVRASMSIPFFFEPVTFDALKAEIDVPQPGGGVIKTHYDAGTVTWVDGGMLRNFPIDAFARIDGAPPRWPTIGIKLSSLQTSFGATEAAKNTYKLARGCLSTMMNEWDAYSVDESTAARTIFVANAGLTATDFDLTTAQQNELFLNGVNAATAFVIAMGARGRVPRTAQEARELNAPTTP
jgi:NTE family protein